MEKRIWHLDTGFDANDRFFDKLEINIKNERSIRSKYESQQLLYSAEPYKPSLDVTVTKEYTHPSAWAHTIPSEKNICIRPPEFIDYNLGFRRVLGHEIGHNMVHAYGLPDDDEDIHTKHAYQNLNSGMFDLKSKYAI